MKHLDLLTCCLIEVSLEALDPLAHVGDDGAQAGTLTDDGENGGAQRRALDLIPRLGTPTDFAYAPAHVLQFSSCENSCCIGVSLFVL